MSPASSLFCCAIGTQLLATKYANRQSGEHERLVNLGVRLPPWSLRCGTSASAIPERFFASTRLTSLFRVLARTKLVLVRASTCKHTPYEFVLSIAVLVINPAEIAQADYEHE